MSDEIIFHNIIHLSYQNDVGKTKCAIQITAKEKSNNDD